MEPGSEEARSQAPTPFIEIAEEDPRTSQPHALENFFSQQSQRLFPALEKRRTHVHIENVQN